MVVVDAGGSGAVHMAAPGTHEGSAWRHALHQAATNCGPDLEQQQLTQDNVPVILDKCINFIYVHGKKCTISARVTFNSEMINESKSKDFWIINAKSPLSLASFLDYSSFLI